MAMPDNDYDDVVAALEAADGDGPTGSILRRVIREARDDPAHPAPLDYLTAIKASAGTVALELNGADDLYLAHDADGDVYQLAGDREDYIASPRAAALVDDHGAEPVLFNDVADAFEDDDDDEGASDDPQPTYGTYRGP